MIFDLGFNENGSAKLVAQPLVNAKNAIHGMNLTDEDYANIKKYNKAISNGTVPAIENESDAFKALKNEANGAKIEVGQVPLKTKAVVAGLKMIKTALNSIAFMAVLTLVNEAVSWVSDNIIHRAETLSKKADELYAESSERVSQNKEEAKSIDTLIDKYEELARSGNIDADTREEIQDIQYDIAELVGIQASNLDLVNGKLDEELKKLKAIQAEESENNIEDAELNYYRAKNAEDSATGAESFGVDFRVDKDKALNNIDIDFEREFNPVLDELNEAAGKEIVSFTALSNEISSKIKINTSDLDFDEKIEALNNLYTYLQEIGEGSSNLAVGVYDVLEHYQEYTENTATAVQDFVDSLTTNYAMQKTVYDEDSYERARKDIINSVSQNELVKTLVDDGEITEDVLKSTINSVISTMTGFSDWYDNWKEKYLTDDGSTLSDVREERLQELQDRISNISLFNGTDAKNQMSDYVGTLNDEELDTFYNFSDVKLRHLLKNSKNAQQSGETITSHIEEVVDSAIEEAQKRTIDDIDPTTITFDDIFTVTSDNDSSQIELSDTFENLFAEIEKVKSSYDALKDAQEEYNKSGIVSIDTLKTLMETGDDWLSLMSVEDAQLKINQEGYIALAQAKLESLKIEMYESISNQITGLENVAEAQAWVAQQNNETAESYSNETNEIRKNTLAHIQNQISKSSDNSEVEYWEQVLEAATTAFDKIDNMISSIDPMSTVFSDSSTSGLSEQLDVLKEHADLINSINDDIEDNGKITLDTLNSIASAYPKLEMYVNDYINGVEGSQQKLIDVLNEAYETDIENYKEYLKVKYLNDTDFWKTYVNNCGSAVNNLADQYGIDLSNYASYAEAIQKLNQKLIESANAVAQARAYAMNLTTGDITSSATVAGLNSSQKTAVNNLWNQIVNEYSTGQVVDDSYEAIQSRVRQILHGQVDEATIKQIGTELRQQAVHLLSVSGDIEALETLIPEIDTDFGEYVANYVDAFDTSALSPSSFDSDSSSDSKEDFDWVETKIENLTEALEKLKNKASDTYSTWSTRNSSLQQSISKTQEAINLQAQAYQVYMDKANSIGLSSTYKTLVQNGALKIDTIYDEDLKEKISEYQEWYDKAKECLETQQDLKDSLNELNSQKFENIQSKYEALINSLETQRDLLESQVDVLTDVSAYNELRKQQTEIINKFKAERDALNATLNSLSITKYSEEWYELSSQIQEINQSIQDAGDKLEEISKLQFDNLKEFYELSIDLLEKQKDLSESRITLISSSEDYDNLAKQQQELINLYTEELNKLNELRNSSVFNAMSYEDQMDVLSSLADLNSALEEAYSTLNEISKLHFDNLEELYSFDIDNIDHEMQLLQDQLDLLEMKGLFANEQYYNAMMAYTQQKIDVLTQEREQLAEILNSSAYEQGTSEWNDMFSALMDIDEELSGLNNDMVEFNNSIRDLNWEVFEYLEDAISRIADETDYLVDLLSREKLFDTDTGAFTKYATTTIGLHATAYDVYKQQALDYYEEMQELEQMLVTGAGKDVLEQYYEMVDAHQDAIQAMLDEKEAILDLIEEGYNAQLDALNELIDKKKEALSAEKDLYDYQKSIKEKTDNISSLQKQLVSTAGDNSEDAMAKIQKIKVELQEAREDLEETEYEQYLADTERMLDELSTDFEDWMNARLDNSDALLAEIIGNILGQSSVMQDTLVEVTDKNGTMLSESMNTIFSAESPFTGLLIDSINNSGYNTQNSVDNMGSSMADGFNNTNNGMSDGFNNTNGTLADGFNNTNGTMSNGFNNTNNTLSSGFNSVGNTISSGVNNVIGKISGTTTAIDNLISKVSDITNIVAKTVAGSSTSSSTSSSSSSTNTSTSYTPITSTTTSGNTTSSNKTNTNTTTSTPTTSNKTNTSNNTTSSSSNSTSSSNKNNTSSSSSSSNSSSSNSSGIFEYLYDSYPKSRLNTNYSVVDRLKYHNYNSSFSARARYWKKLGFTGTYTGSDSQNVKMLNWMKNNGYKKGTPNVPKSGFYPTQEEGLELIERNGVLLTPLKGGDKVFNASATKRLYELANSEELTEQLKKTMTPTSIGVETFGSRSNIQNTMNNSNSISFGDTNVSIAQANNIDDIVDGLTKSKRFEDMICYVINEKAMGRSTVGKNKFIRH